MDSTAQDNLAPLIVVYLKSSKSRFSTCLRQPALRTIAGKVFIQGMTRWRDDHWLSGARQLVPLDDVAAIFEFTGEAEYAQACARYQASKSAPPQAQP